MSLDVPRKEDDLCVLVFEEKSLELEEFAEVLVLKVVILEIAPPLGEYFFELAVAVELVVYD